MTAQDTYVENFRESVRVCQQCLMWCIAASFSGLLLAWKMSRMSPEELARNRVPILFGEVRIPDAWSLALLVYLVLGSYAAYTAGMARLNAGKLSGEQSTLKALRLYPSLATAENSFFRMGAAILPMGLMITSCIIEILRERRTRPDTPDNDFGAYLMLLLIVTTPYGLLVSRLRKSVAEAEQEPPLPTAPEHPEPSSTE